MLTSSIRKCDSHVLERTFYKQYEILEREKTESKRTIKEATEAISARNELSRREKEPRK